MFHIIHYIIYKNKYESILEEKEKTWNAR